MAVSVARGVRRRIREDPGGIAVQVQRASDPQAAAEALRRAAAEIAELDGGWESAPGLLPGSRNGPTRVGRVVELPTGPYLFVDGGHTPADLLATIPDIVARHVSEAGVARAVVASPGSGGGPFDFLVQRARGVALCLYPQPPPPASPPRRWAKVPPHWLEEAVAWVREGLADDAPVWARVDLDFPLPAAEAMAAFDLGRRSGSAAIVSGDVDERVRGAGAMFIAHQRLALGGGGPATTDDELVAMAEALAALARRLAPDLGYAYVRVDATSASLRDVGVSGIEALCDEVVVDAFPWQVLGPRHLERLARAGASLNRPGLTEGPMPLAGGRVELAIGPVTSWIYEPDPSRPWWELERRDPAIQQAGRELLAPCLLTQEEYRQAFGARIRAGEEGS